MSASSTIPISDAMGLAQMRRPPTHPGAMLAEMLRDIGVPLAEAARRLGMSKQQLHAIRTGQRPMSTTVCVRVAALMGTSPEFWAQLQMRHDVWHAIHDEATAVEARAIVPVTEALALLHFIDGSTTAMPVPTTPRWPPTLRVSRPRTPGAAFERSDDAVLGDHHTFALETIDCPTLAHYVESVEHASRAHDDEPRASAAPDADLAGALFDRRETD